MGKQAKPRTIEHRQNLSKSWTQQRRKEQSIRTRKMNMSQKHQEKCRKGLIGHPVSKNTRQKISNTLKLNSLKGSDHPNWNGGSSFGKYCPKFNDEFKERVREFWGRKCGISGVDESCLRRRLDVHHVSYNKKACCEDEKKFNCAPNLFIAVSEYWNKKFNKHRDYWEEVLTNYIMIYYNGECYL